MTKRSFGGLLAAAFLLLAFSATAGQPKTLPAGVVAHISATSPVELLQSVDGYAAGVTQGTGNTVPPGFLSMMLMMSLPGVFDSWDSDGETHLFVVDDESSRRKRYVLRFGVEDFEAFVDSLESRDWLVGERRTEEPYGAVCPFVIPGGDAMVAVDMGDGAAAVGNDVETIRKTLSGWTPEHNPRSDLCVTIPTGGRDVPLAEMFGERMTDARRAEIAGEIAELGFKPDVAKGIVKTLDLLVPSIAAEIDKVENIVIECSFVNDDIVIDVTGGFARGSLFEEMGEHLAGGKPVDAGAVRGLPAGAFSVGVTAAPADILPDIRTRTLKLLDDVYGAILPEYKDKAVSASEEWFDAGPGVTVQGNYIDGVKQYSLSFFRCRDPEKGMNSIARGLVTFNEMFAAAVVDPEYAIAFEPASIGGDATPAFMWRPVIGDAENFESFIREFGVSVSDAERFVNALAKLRLYLARTGDGLLMGIGEMDEDRFLSALRNFDGKAEVELLATPAARALVKTLVDSQASLALISSRGAFNLYAAQTVAEAGYSPAELDAVAGAVAEVQKKSGDGAFGFSLGSRGGALVTRIVVPAGAVNDIVKDVELFSRLRKKALESISADDGEDEGDEDDPDAGELDDGESPEAA